MNELEITAGVSKLLWNRGHLSQVTANALAPAIVGFVMGKMAASPVQGAASASDRGDFDAAWAREIADNGGVNIGADYRHWMFKGYRAALAERAQAAQPSGAEQALHPYDALFRAIGDATKIEGRALAISVKQFVETLSSKGYKVIATPAPEQEAAQITDADRWQAFRNRDSFDDLNFMHFQDQFGEDADAIIDAAILKQNK